MAKEQESYGSALVKARAACLAHFTSPAAVSAWHRRARDPVWKWPTNGPHDIEVAPSEDAVRSHAAHLAQKKHCVALVEAFKSAPTDGTAPREEARAALTACGQDHKEVMMPAALQRVGALFEKERVEKLQQEQMGEVLKIAEEARLARQAAKNKAS